jgi:GT2 family glycosyltransferase
LAIDVPSGAVSLQCLNNDGSIAASYPLKVNGNALNKDASVQFEPALAALRKMHLLDDSAMHRLESDKVAEAASTSYAVGALDEVHGSYPTGQAVVSGWLVCEKGVKAWLEDSRGTRFDFGNAYRVEREDIAHAVPARLKYRAQQAGFLARIEGVGPGERIRLVVSQGKSEDRLAELPCTDWGLDAKAASSWLMSCSTPLTRLADRIRRIDLPLIDPMIRAAQEHWSELAVRVENVGDRIGTAKVSIIVPLYGRFDFVEHQLVEFARDPWLREHAEVVYVIDDNRLVDRMATEAWTLHRLYDIPFRWVWGGINRGFSGANNLGADHSSGEYLVFLNSDAFPLGPGWLEALVAALEGDVRLGAVGPRLLFADGSIQHAGMTFRRREDLGIVVNHHPGMGLDPLLDPSSGLTEVACVTGACMAMRRSDFEVVGRWDTGYLIGDFEDSDLCMKLREAGKYIGYLPTVEVTHLERQSFKLLGDGDYRTRVVIYNAVRHQNRWKEVLDTDLALAEVRND